SSLRKQASKQASTSFPAQMAHFDFQYCSSNTILSLHYYPMSIGSFAVEILRIRRR
ncbi:hypothetical protein BDZ91DRAFT_727750, partial [Kalaharituber pfeilii]